MKPIIIAISGASGAGKTTLTRFLQREFNIPAIVSSTTRPRRSDETEGVDYFFIAPKTRPKLSDMLTYTRFGGYAYFSLRKQLPRTGFCSYVVEENGIRSLKSKAGEEYGLFSVTVQCKLEIRIARGVDPARIERDRNRKNLGYEWVDYALFNNGTLREFEQAARDMMKILEQWQHLQ